MNRLAIAAYSHRRLICHLIALQLRTVFRSMVYDCLVIIIVVLVFDDANMAATGLGFPRLSHTGYYFIVVDGIVSVKLITEHED